MEKDLKGLDKEFWSSKYENQLTGWDMGRVSPPIQAYIDQLEDKDLRILIPGAGNSYEAEYLINNGFTNVTVVDISRAPLSRLEKLFPDSENLHLIETDFFKHQGEYDLVFEQTFFCAIHPSLRKDYVKHMKTLIAQGGKLVGLLFEMDKPEGPPFGGDSEEYRELFSDDYHIHKMELCYNSHPARQGRELWIDFRRG